MSKPKKSKRGGKAGTFRKTRSTKTAFVGKWRIVEMEAWDEDYFEMDGPAYVEVEKNGTGDFKFGIVEGEMDCRFAVEDDRPVMEFSWEGADEGHPMTGRGRAAIESSGKMHGRFFIHHGDDSGFVAKRRK